MHPPSSESQYSASPSSLSRFQGLPTPHPMSCPCPTSPHSEPFPEKPNGKFILSTELSSAFLRFSRIFSTYLAEGPKNRVKLLYERYFLNII
eukprot:904469-Amorphochlora_amoeboformis.AAC.2